ncbi:MAG: Rne/Rng family ribonuclease [Deltaproteobacteria bacterium]|nr:MAG: Rne/Rng family ribonuclease [Deltaproteobacteria bacterium]
MAAELIINVTEGEVRVALLENGTLAEIFYERDHGLGIVGNIYNGRVVKVLPGMDAAFVDIGLDKAAFLYVADVRSQEDQDPFLPADEVAVVDEEFVIATDELDEALPAPQIDDLLKEGQEILVQVSREPIGTKGARVTTYNSLPGRYLVLLPTVDHVGISRKIEDEDERQRLKDLVTEIKPEGMGLIVRTVSEGKLKADLQHDLEFLVKLWENINLKKEKTKSLNLVYQDLRLVQRIIRDLYSDEIDRLVIDSDECYHDLKDFIANYLPGLVCELERYTGIQPIFQAYDIEIEVNKALERKVWLKSGGYIVVESTEALTAIDVNTGRFVGKKNLEDTILKTNLEAAKEIAFQLRLRNIGGIIIIDFIDMEKKNHRERVNSSLEEALKRDKAKSNVLKISELGLVEMTRERVRNSIARMLCDPCPHCEGRGFVKSKATVTFEIVRELKSFGYDLEVKELIVKINPELIDYIYDNESLSLDNLEYAMRKKITLKKVDHFQWEEYEIIAKI